MSIFGRIKGAFHKKEEGDLDSIRSHVLGEKPSFLEREEPKFNEPKFNEAEFKPFDAREPIEFGRPSFGLEREPFQAERPERKDYDILERLNVIEAQLSAIRSQTETINERLKNMEMRLPRRY